MTRLHSEEFYYNRKNKPSVFFYRVGLDLLGGVSAAHPLATDSEIPAEARAAEICRKALALENRGDHLVFSGPSFAQAVASVRVEAYLHPIGSQTSLNSTAGLGLSYPALPSSLTCPRVLL